jgi:hypothetical protein
VFEVVTPANDLTLATIEQLRVAAGLASDDGSKDESLTELGARLAEDISTACKIASDGANPPTLRLESVRNTFRLKSHTKELILSRRFVSEISSVVENDVMLTSGTDFELNAEAGLLKRLSGDCEIYWRWGKTVVEYIAGFKDVPAALSGVVVDETRLRLSESTRDPAVKSETTEGIDRVDYWVGDMPNSSDAPLSDSNMRRLTRFINPVFG